METATLITLPVSHYCEKVRWALDHLAIPYKEAAYAPAFHRKATGKHGGTTVPVLAHAGNSMQDSSDILNYLNGLADNQPLYTSNEQQRAEILALEALFDAELGTSVRRWAYSLLLSEPKLLRKIWSTKVPFWQGLVVPFIIPRAQKLIRKMYRADESATDEALAQVDSVFNKVETIIADGREFLVGDALSAADITFAALAAPILLPPQCPATMPALEELPQAMQCVVNDYRARPAGQFVLNLYANHRK